MKVIDNRGEKKDNSSHLKKRLNFSNLNPGIITDPFNFLNLPMQIDYFFKVLF